MSHVRHVRHTHRVGCSLAARPTHTPHTPHTPHTRVSNTHRYACAFTCTGKARPRAPNRHLQHAQHARRPHHALRAAPESPSRRPLDFRRGRAVRRTCTHARTRTRARAHTHLHTRTRKTPGRGRPCRVKAGCQSRTPLSLPRRRRRQRRQGRVEGPRFARALCMDANAEASPLPTPPSAVSSPQRGLENDGPHGIDVVASMFTHPRRRRGPRAQALGRRRRRHPGAAAEPPPRLGRGVMGNCHVATRTRAYTATATRTRTYTRPCSSRAARSAGWLGLDRQRRTRAASAHGQKDIAMRASASVAPRWK
jgi:hypothetical protein